MCRSRSGLWPSGASRKIQAYGQHLPNFLPKSVTLTARLTGGPTRVVEEFPQRAAVDPESTRGSPRYVPTERVEFAPPVPAPVTEVTGQDPNAGRKDPARAARVLAEAFHIAHSITSEHTKAHRTLPALRRAIAATNPDRAARALLMRKL